MRNLWTLFPSRKSCAGGVCLWKDLMALSLSMGNISVVPSSPFPHSYNLITTNKASLPMPTIPKQPVPYRSDQVRKSTVIPQVLPYLAGNPLD